MARDNRFWLVALLAFLTLMFFAAGAALDWDAGSHGLNHVERFLSAHPAAPVDKLLDYQGQRTKLSHESAATAYDIAKVALGAMVSSIAHLMSARSTERGDAS